MSLICTWTENKWHRPHLATCYKNLLNIQVQMRFITVDYWSIIIAYISLSCANRWQHWCLLSPLPTKIHVHTWHWRCTVKAENGHVHRECVQPSLVWNMLSKYCSLFAHSVYILQRRTPLQCSLPGSIALRREVQTVHNLHILICQLHLLHCQEVISLQWTFPLWGWLTLLWWRRGWTQHTHNHHLKLLMLLTKSEEGGENRAREGSEQVEQCGGGWERKVREERMNEGMCNK